MRISDWSSDVCSSDLSRDHGVVVVFRFLPIAQASHGDDLGATGFDFFAQAMTIDFDGIGGDFFTPLAKQIDDLILADRKRVVWGQRVSVRLALGGRLTIKKQSTQTSKNMRDLTIVT